MVVYFQDVVGKKKFLVKFEDRHNKEMIASSLSYLCDKEDVGQEADETTSYLPKK